jgi:23S rRNA (adenine2030-N6)-methyltransferase
VLSYRHGFHAGNAADVLKHFVLTRVLRYLRLKEAPIRYVDTHAGAGLYRLDEGFARKNREHDAGIARLWSADALPEVLVAFLADLAEAVGTAGDHAYPGSSLLATSLLRAHDQAWLYELHPADHAALEATIVSRSRGGCRAYVRREDGFNALPGLLPPPNGRACVLVDPPYEVKDDYVAAARTLAQAWRRMPHGVYLLWYPVVERTRIEQLEQTLVRAGPPSLLRVELQTHADMAGYGMTASGLFLVNPPWTLRDELQAARAAMLRLLATRDGALTTHWVVGEA